MAPSVIIIIGVDRFQSWSFSSETGLNFRSLHSRLIEKRTEYAAVSPVAIKNIIRMIVLEGLKIDSSRIRSFE